MAKRLASPREERVHGSLAAAERGGDLGVGEVVDVAQGEGQPLPRRQAGERGRESLAGGDQRVLVGALGDEPLSSLGQQGERGLGLARPAPALAAAASRGAR